MPTSVVKEIEVDKVVGVKTALLPIILNSGKKFDFYPSSLKTSECQFIVDALHKAMH